MNDSIWSQPSPARRNMQSEREDAPGFDGNRSDFLRNWYFPNEKFKGVSDEMYEGLMEMTEHGNLSWCLFSRGR